MVTLFSKLQFYSAVAELIPVESELILVEYDLILQNYGEMFSTEIFEFGVR